MYKYHLYNKIPNKDVVRLIDKQFNILDVQLLNNIVENTLIIPNLNMLCVKHGNINLLKELPIPNKNELLTIAIILGNIDITKYLVSIGADVNSDDNYAVVYASANGYVELVKYLVSIGTDVSESDNYAVRQASANGYVELVKYLVSVGLDITTCDNTPISYASQNGSY